MERPSPAVAREIRCWLAGSSRPARFRAGRQPEDITASLRAPPVALWNEALWEEEDGGGAAADPPPEVIRVVESRAPGAGRCGVAARPLAKGELFHWEAPLLCVVTDEAQPASVRSCDGCLRPLAPLRDHLEVAAPALLSSLPADVAAQVCSGYTAAALPAATFTCDRCGFRMCATCAGRLLARHTRRACGARARVRAAFPQMWANARFRLFVQLLESESAAGRGDTAGAAAVAALDELCAGADAPPATAAAFEDAMRPTLALLHAAWLDEEGLADGGASTQQHTSTDRSAGSRSAGDDDDDERADARLRLRARLTPAAYLAFHLRAAANTHGVRVAAAPVAGALAELLALSSESEALGEHEQSGAIGGAVQRTLLSDRGDGSGHSTMRIRPIRYSWTSRGDLLTTRWRCVAPQAAFYWRPCSDPRSSSAGRGSTTRASRAPKPSARRAAAAAASCCARRAPSPRATS